MDGELRDLIIRNEAKRMFKTCAFEFQTESIFDIVEIQDLNEYVENLPVVDVEPISSSSAFHDPGKPEDVDMS